MGRKKNNMPIRKKKFRDPNNLQIKGKSGLGKKRSAGRRLKAKKRTAFEKKVERGLLTDAPAEQKGRPESYLELAKQQEGRVSAGDIEPTQDSERKKGKKRKRKDEEEEKTDLLERSHLPEKGVRAHTVDLGGADVEGEQAVNLAAPRPSKKKDSAAVHLPSFCSSGVYTTDPQSADLWPNALVCLTGLQSAPELNGRTASCSSWDSKKERWLVRLDRETEEKALKPGNLKLRACQQTVALRPGSLVRLSGLKDAAALNGALATCIAWDKRRQRWRIRHETGEERLVRPENLKLRSEQAATLLSVGSSVCLAGLLAAPELNGKLGICVVWDADKQRWKVRLEGGEERLLKPENLEVDSTSETLLVGPQVRQTVTVCKERDKLEQLLLFVKKLRQEEKKGLRQRSLTVIFCRHPESLKAVVAALAEAQIACAKLHSGQIKAQRDSQLGAFKLENKTIAVVTDASADGLKSEDVKCIINYDFPQGLARYGDRIRRVLKDGAEGSAHSFFTKTSAAFASGLVSVLENAKASVDPSLRQLALQRAYAKKADAEAGMAPKASDGVVKKGKPCRLKLRMRKGSGRDSQRSTQGQAAAQEQH